MTTTGEVLTNRALELYKPPFRFEHGYFYDADGNMVADKHEGEVMRVRGWGRISYKEDAEALQDEVGRLIAKAMTALWSAPQGNAAQEGYKLDYEFAVARLCMASQFIPIKQRDAYETAWEKKRQELLAELSAAPSNKEVER